MIKKPNKPIIAITMGDPAGIGPEIILQALTGGSLPKKNRCLVIGDRQVLEKTGRRLKIACPLTTVGSPAEIEGRKEDFFLFEGSRLPAGQVKPGRPEGRWGKAALDYIRLGAQWALEKQVQALVTCPISKEVIRETEPGFTGHTEFLAALAGTKRFGMMLAGKRLKVSLVTIHCSLRETLRRLKTRSILETIELTHRTLTRWFGIADPSIAVAGLNPHAGEGGAFGSEEESIVVPAVSRAAQRGLRVSGPHPPDTLFYWAARGRYDAVVALYHDQGLIPLKLLHFDDAVNLTMGLPFIRTSVDHGTAFDIAGQGLAQPDSLLAAIRLAADFIRRDTTWL
ncbi:MAG: 4-hydroxythreonine-4-phosphate dehydrogenase PdxA [Deltaproteobacteria bacterium]|nr:4-hydroxythreonine-4-phosphate dehydrogenase PdxA [Deltaproteobacteria bacterium]